MHKERTVLAKLKSLRSIHTSRRCRKNNNESLGSLPTRSILSIPALLLVLQHAATADVSFRPGKDASEGKANGVQVMDAGDVNGDGHADVVALCGGKHANSSIFAWFEAPSTIQGTWKKHGLGNDSQLRSFLGSCKLYDFDGDGDLDLALSSDNHSGSTKACDLYVYENPGPSRVTGSWNYQRVTSRTQPWHHVNDMAVDDMDQDGKPDIVCRSLVPNTIHIFFQNNMGSWTRKSINTGIDQSEGLAVGDINGDGTPDIEFTGYWLKAPSSPRTGSYSKLKIDAGYKNTNQNTKDDLGDIDGDGDLDLVLAPAEHYRGGDDHILAWYRNPGGTPDNTNWSRVTVQSNLNDIGQAKLRDLDDDGDLDIIIGRCFVSPFYIKVWYNDGDGNFGSPATVSSNKGLYSAAITDFDGDGDLDIAGHETYAKGSRPRVYENEKYSGSSPRPEDTLDAFARIEAEDYDDQSGLGIYDGSSGQKIGSIEDGAWARYADVDFGDGATGFTARVASNTSGGTIELVLDSLDGTLIGSCPVPGTGGWNEFVTKSAPCEVSGGVHDLYLKFTGGSGLLLDVDHFVFDKGSTGAKEGTRRVSFTRTPSDFTSPAAVFSLDGSRIGAYSANPQLRSSDRTARITGCSVIIMRDGRKTEAQLTGLK